MGQMTAAAIADSLIQKHRQGVICVLWRRAAPSAFAFYQSFIEEAAHDSLLADVLKKTHFFQFDDYPIARGSRKFPATFRYLLEKHFINPLQIICGHLPNVHLLEYLAGIEKKAGYKLSGETRKRLRKIRQNADHPAETEQNIYLMEQV